MQFVKLAKVSEFPRGSRRSYSLMARKVGLFREPDGHFFAIEIACKHQNWDMTAGGKREGDILECPRHGWRYDLRTGECLTGNSTPLRRYAVKVEGDDVYVSLLPAE
jgi:nitrite reductase/ring-hydroxylating ferredoxin subunit